MLEKVVALADHWKLLGSALGVRAEDIDAIERNCNGVIECLREVKSKHTSQHEGLLWSMAWRFKITFRLSRARLSPNCTDMIAHSAPGCMVLAIVELIVHLRFALSARLTTKKPWQLLLAWFVFQSLHVGLAL